MDTTQNVNLCQKCELNLTEAERLEPPPHHLRAGDNREP